MTDTSSFPIARSLALALGLCLPPGAARADETKTIPSPPAMQDVHASAPGYAATLSVAAEAAADRPDARAPRGATRVAGLGLLAGLPARVLHFDEPGDGRLWVVGDAYKASFGAEGATYVPFFGSRAPRNFPATFRLASLRAGGETIAIDSEALPVREGNRVVFDRGLVQEVYELSLGSVEQLFVLDGLAGDVELEIAVTSELELAHFASGFELANELGAIRYGEAFALDADGTRHALSATRDGDGITIRVPAERVAAAGSRLVVDPVITTFSLDTTLEEDTGPDVAYVDGDSPKWLVVWERAFSASDGDVYSNLLQPDGTVAASHYMDSTSEWWREVKVASNALAEQFLVVAEVVLSPSVIKGRRRSALPGGLPGSSFLVSGPEVGSKRYPDVGGDPSLIGPTFYMVVYQRDLGSRDIHSRLVGTSGTPSGSAVFINNSSEEDGLPSVSKSNGPAPASLQRWTVVWQRFLDSNSDVYAAQMNWDGTIATPTFPLETTPAYATGVFVSSPTSAEPRSVLAAYSLDEAGAGLLIHQGHLIQGSTVADTVDLSELANASTDTPKGIGSVDCDGDQFVMAAMNATSGTDFNVQVATYSIVGGKLAAAEDVIALGPTTEWEGAPDVACAGAMAGPKLRTMIAWQRDFDDGDIHATLYDADPFTVFCEPGQNGVIACPCGNTPSFSVRGCNNSAGTGGARLVASGTTFPDDVLLDGSGFLPTALCIFLQGDAVVSPGTAFGDGVRCAGGQLVRLWTKNAASGLADYPLAGEPSITSRSAALGAPIPAGSKRYYSVYYRDPAVFACAAPATFNISNAVQVQW